MKVLNRISMGVMALLIGFFIATSTAYAQGSGSGGQGQGQGSGKGKAGSGDQDQPVVVKGNWKKGRIYFKMVCNACHAKEAGGKISPSEKTKAEWVDYFARNIHGPQDGPNKYTVSYFVSREYREDIKKSNRAAAKMLKVPEENVFNDVRAYLVHTAKDSDQPTSCE